MASKSPKYQRGAEIIEFLFTLPIMLAVFFIILQLGVGFMHQSVLANASRAAVREAIRTTPDARQAEAVAAAQRVAVNELATFRSMIPWRETETISVVGCLETPSLGEITVCINQNEQCGDPGLTGATPPWICATISYQYRMPGLEVFLPQSISTLPLFARTTMRSFQ